MKATNECPVCETPTKTNDLTYYCETCGFSIRKKEEQPKQKAV